MVDIWWVVRSFGGWRVPQSALVPTWTGEAPPSKHPLVFVTCVAQELAVATDKINKAFKDFRHIERSLPVVPRGLLGRSLPEVCNLSNCLHEKMRALYGVTFMNTTPFALAIAAAFAATPVMAADLTYSDPAPAYEAPAASTGGWTGAYVGLHAGTGSESMSPFSGDKEFMGGVQAGYNAEMGGAVVGGELELSHMGDTEVDVPGGQLKERHRIAAKAKVGAPLGDTLVYGTAGGAMTSLRDSGNAQGPDGWKPGWLVGAGVEQKFNEQISGRVEYNYTRTGDVRSFNGVSTSETNVSDHTIKAGVNYRF